MHLVVKAEHEFGGRRLNPRKADLQRWRERFAEYMTELGVPATATRRHDRGLAKGSNNAAIYRAAQRAPRERSRPPDEMAFTTMAGDSTFMRRKLESVKRQARADAVRDPEQYQSLLNVRAGVNERYRDAVVWLRQQGREDEARRFELMHRHLPTVRTENQVMSEALMARAAETSRLQNTESARTR